MNNRRTVLMLLSLLMVLALGLSACGGTPTTPAEPTTEAVVEQPTEAVVEEVAPTEEPAPAPTEAPAEVATEAPAEETADQPFAGEDLVIGLMTDKSGALAIYGPSQTNGFYLGLEYATGGTMEVAGRPIVVVEKDNSSDPDTAVQQARELIEAEGADILIGNISSSAALATIPVAEENNIIFIAEPAAAPQITADNFGPSTFRTSRISYQDALPLLRAVVSAHPFRCLSDRIVIDIVPL